MILIFFISLRFQNKMASVGKVISALAKPNVRRGLVAATAATGAAYVNRDAIAAKTTPYLQKFNILSTPPPPPPPPPTPPPSNMPSGTQLAGGALGLGALISLAIYLHKQGYLRSQEEVEELVSLADSGVLTDDSRE